MLVGLAAVLAVAGPAAAHALPQSSDPAAGATLPASPKQVTITFGEQPDTHLSLIRVLDSSGQNHTSGPTQAVAGQPRTLHVSVNALDKGVYTVSWRTVSVVDGHLATGSFAFGVGVTPTAAASASFSSRSPRPAIPDVVARWLVYAGLMLIVGTALLALIGGVGLPRRIALLLGGGCGLAIAGAVAIAVNAARASHLGLGDIAGTSIARQLAFRAVPTAVAAVLTAVAFARRVPGRVRRLLVGAVGLAGLAAMWGDVEASHVAASRSWRYERMAIQWGHFAAAGIWVGGLIALLALLRDAEDRGRLARRFSAVALVAVAVVAASGAERAYDEVGTLHHLFATAFGQYVLLKVGLLAVIVVFAAANRYRALPALRRGADSSSLLVGVRSEILLAVGVLAATGILQSLAPPSTVPSPPKPLVVKGADFATTVRVTLAVTPATAGFNSFTLTAADYDTGKPVGTGASLRFALPSRPDVGTSTLSLRAVRPGRYAGTGANLSIDGTWTVTVDLQQARGGVEIPLTVATRVPPQRITVQHFAGLPDVYTIQLPEQQSLQVYLDPGHAGFNEFHATFVGANGQEVPMTAAQVTATPGGSLPVRRLDQIGHFVADLAGAAKRPYHFEVDASAANGESFRVTITIPVH